MRALFGKRKKDIFSEREILSTFQKYLLPVKRRPRFSAEILWICFETVIHNDGYYGLSFFFFFYYFGALLDFSVWETKKKSPSNLSFCSRRINCEMKYDKYEEKNSGCDERFS